MPAATVNKSAAIRSLLDASPNMPAREVIEILAARKIKVKEGLVSNVRAHMRHNHKIASRPALAPATKPAQAPVPRPVSTVDTIRRVKGLAGEVGGPQKLTELVSAIFS